ncbi:RHS repeat-associated core domain-containing protein, partial [Limisphaera sp. 4302-co]|uniref:RHS repeat-associated core domain-containing protein n=1 Tax=Limisphaera sp. 4302-co TaxID=3400417 RepID=UPI003C17BBB2
RGRRVRQTSYILSNGLWLVVEDLNLVSDRELFGRHIGELNATNNALGRAYIWGLDLSETLEGAGGVGGLLWVRMATGPAAGTHFVCYDGNANLWNLVSASTGTETPRYEYGPFGEPMRLSGPVARSNSFRFTTKRIQEFTGLVLYEYWAYSPSLGRWLSRDPLEETGGLAIGAYSGNGGPQAWDILGGWYDSVTAYYRGCAQMHCVGTGPYWECVCVTVAGSAASKDCVDNCARCARLLARGSKGRVSVYDMCLCGCQLANRRAAKAGTPKMDCAAVCKHLAK